MKQDAWKLLAVLDATRRFFAEKQIENPRLQAELLLADVLRVRRLDLYLQFERVLETPEVDAYREHVKKRVQRIPLQLSLIHISEPTRRTPISYAVFC